MTKKAPPFAEILPHRREGCNDKRKGVRTAVAENKVTLQKEQEKEAKAIRNEFAEADVQEQRDALAFMRGVQFGKAMAKTAQESA